MLIVASYFKIFIIMYGKLGSHNAAISLDESNLWRSLTTKEHTWLQTWFQTPLCTVPRRVHIHAFNNVSRNDRFHIAMCLRVLRDGLVMPECLVELRRIEIVKY